ncbi:aspartic peptidase domain-containing protein [Rhizophagus diaphanus]|nr:aspartic peptidase domain-containing protein [Rhizophagus diaphanus] [Rhizophagus sp. MUCL 43196]
MPNFDIQFDTGSGDLFVFEATGDSAKTTIVIAGISVEAQEFGVVNDIIGDSEEHPYEGIMGMAFSDTSQNEQTTPITNLINNNQLDNPQFSFKLGRDADQSPSELTVDNGDGSYALPCEEEHDISLVFSGKTWNIDPRDFTVEIDEDDCIGSVVYADTGSDTEWHIGSAFLKNVYTIFDQGNRQVGFAQLT